MKLFIDTEYDGAELISMGIVAENGLEYYEVVNKYSKNMWICENVLPKLNKQVTTYLMAQEMLRKYLHNCRQEDNNIVVVADWPDDIVHFCRMLITYPGERFGGNLTFELWNDLPPYSDSPFRHNALVDAKLLREVYNEHFKVD